MPRSRGHSKLKGNDVPKVTLRDMGQVLKLILYPVLLPVCNALLSLLDTKINIHQIERKKISELPKH